MCFVCCKCGEATLPRWARSSAKSASTTSVGTNAVSAPARFLTEQDALEPVETAFCGPHQLGWHLRPGTFGGRFAGKSADGQAPK